MKTSKLIRPALHRRLLAAGIVVLACAGHSDAQEQVGLAQRASASPCAVVLAAAAEDPNIGSLSCFENIDLTSANPATIPPDNSVPGLPPGAFVPRTDANNIPGLGLGSRYPITRQVPGIQISGTMADDSGARWLVRLPYDYTGRLAVGVPAGARSEHALDITHNDYFVQNGYAFAASNKGHLASRPSDPSDPLACPGSPPGGPGENTYTHGYQLDLPDPRAVWVARTIQIAAIAKELIVAVFRELPHHTYLTGASAGGLVTRRIMETDPDEFDGGLDWMGPYNNRDRIFNGLVGEFALGLHNFPEYRDSGYSTDSEGYLAMRDAYLPSDTFGSPTPSSPVGSYLETHYNGPWWILECNNIKAFDPENTGAVSDYDYVERVMENPELLERIAQIDATGNLQHPLIVLNGTLDANSPVQGARLYREDVFNAGRGDLHRLYEVQNGTHRDRYRDSPTNFAAVEYMELHFVEAFERLVQWVEQGVEPPPGQCIPRGGSLVDDPEEIGRPEHCISDLEE